MTGHHPLRWMACVVPLVAAGPACQNHQLLPEGVNPSPLSRCRTPTPIDVVLCADPGTWPSGTSRDGDLTLTNEGWVFAPADGDTVPLQGHRTVHEQVGLVDPIDRPLAEGTLPAHLAALDDGPVAVRLTVWGTCEGEHAFSWTTEDGGAGVVGGDTLGVADDGGGWRPRPAESTCSPGVSSSLQATITPFPVLLGPDPVAEGDPPAITLFPGEHLVDQDGHRWLFRAAVLSSTASDPSVRAPWSGAWSR